MKPWGVVVLGAGILGLVLTYVLSLPQYMDSMNRYLGRCPQNISTGFYGCPFPTHIEIVLATTLFTSLIVLGIVGMSIHKLPKDERLQPVSIVRLFRVRIVSGS